ncbi:MAG: hypothetical protein NWE99_01890 [Candidatus Bathyarchaeota archaeon]|nr:hypothetical protein [Candidatus Bathyarchaeota archaeon]
MLETDLLVSSEIKRAKGYKKEQPSIKRAKKRLNKKSGKSSPSSYSTVPYYFIEQTDIVDELNREKIIKRAHLIGV